MVVVIVIMVVPTPLTMYALALLAGSDEFSDVNNQAPIKKIIVPITSGYIDYLNKSFKSRHMNKSFKSRHNGIRKKNVK